MPQVKNRLQRLATRIDAWGDRARAVCRREWDYFRRRHPQFERKCARLRNAGGEGLKKTRAALGSAYEAMKIEAHYWSHKWSNRRHNSRDTTRRRAS